jgi:hypothetical protein
MAVNPHAFDFDLDRGIRDQVIEADMQCQFLTLKSEWWVVAAEFALMTTYEPEWNFTGFGSKTPCRGRPGTERISAWDQMFPPKIA